MKKAVEKLMNEKGFKLVRSGNHSIWRDSEGLTIVTSRTPSDHRALKNIESTIRKARGKHLSFSRI